MADGTGFEMSGRNDVFWQDTRVADSYSLSRPAIPMVEEQLDAMVRVIRAVACPTASVLDLGAGDGEVAAVVASHFPVDRIVLVDFSSAMSQGTRARFTGWSGEIDVIEADLIDPVWQTRLPEAVAPFDLVVSRYAIHHLPDVRKQALYTEVFDLLRPGGLFFNIEHVKSVADVYSHIFDELIIEGIHAASPGSDLESVAVDYHARWDGESNILALADAQCGWLRDTGFVDVDVVMKVFELAVIVGRRPGPNL